MSDPRKPFVEKLRIQNFGCARDVELELTPLHALIGPNDSGKSTVLSALRTTCAAIHIGDIHTADSGRLDSRIHADSKITVGTGAHEFDMGARDGEWDLGTGSYEVLNTIFSDMATPLRGATMVRWDPDAIRQPSALIPEDQPLTIGERGEGLSAVYEAVLSRDRSAFGAIEDGVRKHFPTIKGIWLPTSSDGRKQLGVILNDGTKVNSSTLSEGLLYWLAFASIPHMEPTAILLVEEPENGLHPSRIAEVMASLRAISDTMQVILATHSPLVINEMQPSEVTILTRDAKTGTRATRMDRTKHFQQRQKVYALGELWLSFADGTSEDALVPDDTSNPAG